MKPGTATVGGLVLPMLLAWTALAGDTGARPLKELPYTPGLDPSALDRSVDPCDDFYQYACGGWIANNPIPPDRASWNVYSKLANDNLQYLWGILQAASDPNADRDPVQRQIGDYFAACMDTDAIDARGSKPLAPILTDISRLKSRDQLAPLVARLHDEMSNGDLLFGYTALPDFEHTETMIGTFFSGGTGLPERDYYLSDEPEMREARQRYEQHIAVMLTLIGESQRSARQSARRILEFETHLATAQLSATDRQDLTQLNHPMDGKALQAAAPGFDWLAYLRLRSPATLERVNVTEPEFMAEIGRLLRQTPLAHLRAYLRWSYLRGHAEMLARPIADEAFAFNSGFLHGVREQPPRWRTCVTMADKDLGEALGREFVARTFTPSTRQQAMAMIESIESVMRQRIEQADWMSRPTKDQALAKLAGIRNKIGHPETWRDYSPVEIDREDYFGNRVAAAAFEEARQMGMTGRPVDPDEWFMTPQTVNAFYDPQRNEMNFPAGVLQPPLFDMRIDAAPRWGNTGETMGHELVHAFDDTGRHFDADGNLVDWWTAEDAAEFERRTQCLVDQYGSYTVIDDVKLNSRLTLGEDIADLVGTTLAYVGWKLATEGEPLEARDGLSPEQRFFVGNAQWACGAVTDQHARVKARTSIYAPLRYRINGVVVNMPEFSRAFQCTQGDTLHKPEGEVCKIW
jgi:putative endopeptidase